MKINKITKNASAFPVSLSVIPNPPRIIYTLGDNLEKLWAMPKISVVGSRRATPYGITITKQLAGAAASKGVVIVSGLALGIDAVAHKAALEVGGKTIAVLPCGLDRFYPSTNHQLAKQILETGGAIISEYPEGTEPYPANFIERNRLVSGLGDVLLVTEAAEKSGTLHTVNFALEQGKTVLAVPGNITSPLSAGTNQLIKTGATPVTNVQDVLDALGIKEQKEQGSLDLQADTAEEFVILKLLREGVSDGSDLLRASELATTVFNQTLTMLELSGKIKPLGAGHWTLN